ncbi:hypothetical protein KS4_27960 [Poriferisphaera corsica]|uniref:Uncharacterized protein n=1 Tax=Poriferisphaera corsica TaxID=2528020 RepID=A0A517YWY1_9BACT|nr:hypothetical protein [Poriferisphaera corsica]QDU34722.1 hypothetical protein KS4_27960 [Poriferisphaera corsica]
MAGSKLYARDVGLYCIGCGYDLRGMEVKAKCPECGLDVSCSRCYGRAITDAVWTKAVYRGSGLMYWGMIVFGAWIALCIIFGVFIGADSIAVWLPIHGIAACGVALMGLGIWRLATPSERVKGAGMLTSWGIRLVMLAVTGSVFVVLVAAIFQQVKLNQINVYLLMAGLGSVLLLVMLGRLMRVILNQLLCEYLSGWVRGLAYVSAALMVVAPFLLTSTTGGCCFLVIVFVFVLASSLVTMFACKIIHEETADIAQDDRLRGI